MYEEEVRVKTSSGTRKTWKKFIHAQWLQHGSQMLLQEAAHPDVLFYLKECDNLPVECIYQHCNLHVLGTSDREPSEASHSQLFYAR